MANDNTKLQYIVELLTQGDTKKATDELNRLNKSGEGAAKGMASAADSAKQLFAFLGGTALITESINKFLEAERAVNALNAALEMTGNGTPEVIAQVRQLADVLGDELKRDADDVVKVMTQLVTFGANPKDLRRLTESVFDLSEVMGRDVGRAARGMSQALRGNFEVFQQLGIEVDKSKSATDGFNEAYERMILMITGRAKRAVEGAAGDIEKLKVTLDDAKEKIGEWTTAVLTATAGVGANLGRLWDREKVDAAVRAQKEQYIALADAIAKAILEAEKLNKITKEEAGVLFGKLGGARQLLRGGLLDIGATTSDEDLQRMQESVLPQAGGLLSDLQKKLGARGGIGAGAGPAQAGPGAVETPGLSERDIEQFYEDLMAMDRQLADQINSNMDLRIKAEGEALKLEEQYFQDYKNGEEMKQQLADQYLMTVLDGAERERAVIEMNHRERLRQIEETRFATGEQYDEAIAREEQLHQAEQKRYAEANSFAGDMNASMAGMVDQGMRMFSDGLAGAIVDAFEEGDKAFQKFAANFLRQIAEMILQTIIFNTLRAAGRSLGFFADGGQATALANGGMIYAAAGVAGVSELSSPTYFPKFNVLAGEAGREVMTVLSRPRFERINGVPMQIGYAQGRRLAIGSADAMAGATGGAGGTARILVEMAPGLVASIKEDSIQGSRVAIVQDMAQDSQLSRVTRQKMA